MSYTHGCRGKGLGCCGGMTNSGSKRLPGLKPGATSKSQVNARAWKARWPLRNPINRGQSGDWRSRIRSERQNAGGTRLRRAGIGGCGRSEHRVYEAQVPG